MKGKAVKKTTLRAGCLLLATLITNSAWSALVTYNYTGEVFTGTGVFAGMHRAVITGTFSFDDQLVNTDAGPLAFSNGFDSATVANGPITQPYVATFNLGTFSTTLDGPGDIDLMDRFTLDSVVLQARGNGTTLQLSAADRRTLLGDPDGVLPGSDGLSGNIQGAISVLDTLDLSLFTNVLRESRFAWFGRGDVVIPPFSETDLGRTFC